MQTYAGRIEIYNAACRQAAEQALRDAGVAFTRYDGGDWWRLDVRGRRRRRRLELPARLTVGPSRHTWPPGGAISRGRRSVRPSPAGRGTA